MQADISSAHGISSWSSVNLEKIIRDACLVYDISLDGYQLIRKGSNAVFLIRGTLGLHQHPASFALKVNTSDIPLDFFKTQVNFCDWLNSQGFPVAPPAGEAIEIEECRMTLWHYCSPDESAEIRDAFKVGELLRSYHSHAEDYPKINTLPKKHGSDIHRIVNRLSNGNCNLLNREEKDFLLGSLDDISEELEGFSSILGDGVVHGDMNMSNIIPHKGKYWLIDFDGFGIDAKERDISKLAFVSKFYKEKNFDLKEFYRGYGLSEKEQEEITEAIQPLIEIRALNSLAWLASAMDDQAAEEEVKKRLEYFRKKEPVGKHNIANGITNSTGKELDWKSR